MLKDFMFMGKEIDASKLMTQAAFLRKMRKRLPTDTALDSVRKGYEARFGMNLAWRIPTMDEPHRGAVILPVQEGFLYLPLSPLSTGEDVTYDLAGMELLNKRSADALLHEFKDYADGLISALGDIKNCEEVAVPAESMVLELPNGQVLRAIADHDQRSPSLSIYLDSGESDMQQEPLCFAEYDPKRPAGHQLCLGVYAADKSLPDYYKSFSPLEEGSEETE